MNKKKYHFASCDLVIFPMVNEGMVIGDLTLMNLALGDKLFWRIIQGKV